jgi:hypothetical protein
MIDYIAAQMHPTPGFGMVPTEDTKAIIDSLRKLEIDAHIVSQGLAGDTLQFLYRGVVWAIGDIGDNLGVYIDTPDTYSLPNDAGNQNLNEEVQWLATERLTFDILECETGGDVAAVVHGYLSNAVDADVIRKFFVMYGDAVAAQF